MNVCITGTSRGIGKTLTELYASQNDFVVAGARNPQEESTDRIIRVTQDVTKPKEAAEAFLSALKGEKIDLLIHNAGVFPKKEGDSLRKAEAQTISDAVFVNAAAPVEITKHLFLASAFNNNAKIVGVSSAYGSIMDTKTPKFYSYAISKAAMNMAFCILSRELELENIACFALSPGWIKTDMGGSQAPLTLEETCPLIIETIRSWKIGDPLFVNYTGRELNW